MTNKGFITSTPVASFTKNIFVIDKEPWQEMLLSLTPVVNVFFSFSVKFLNLYHNNFLSWRFPTIAVLQNH
jgi:hypothetical protein